MFAKYRLIDASAGLASLERKHVSSNNKIKLRDDSSQFSLLLACRGGGPRRRSHRRVFVRVRLLIARETRKCRRRNRDECVSCRRREDRFDVGPSLDEFDHVGEFPLARDAGMRQQPECCVPGCSRITG